MPDLHPLLVHFPIALLTLYAIAELLRFNRLQSQPYWFYLKAVLVIVGALSALPTVLFGVLAKARFETVSDLANTHGLMGYILAGWALILAIAYLIAWMNRSTMWLGLSGYPRFFLNGSAAFISALILLALVFSVAALGGAMVYGRNNDPITSFIYNIFF